MCTIVSCCLQLMFSLRRWCVWRRVAMMARGRMGTGKCTQRCTIIRVLLSFFFFRHASPPTVLSTIFFFLAPPTSIYTGTAGELRLGLRRRLRSVLVQQPVRHERRCGVRFHPLGTPGARLQPARKYITFDRFFFLFSFFFSFFFRDVLL